MIIGRRKFFSFFGTGVAMLSKPELFVPKNRPRFVTLHISPEEIHVWEPGLRGWSTVMIQAIPGRWVSIEEAIRIWRAQGVID